MYDITKTRTLLMTAVFAAVAAVFAGGANAAIGTAMATQAVATAPAFPSGHGLDTAIGTAMATQAVTTAPRVPERPRARYGNRHGNGDPGGSDARSRVGHAQRRAAGPAGERAHGCKRRGIFPDTSDVVSRYLGNDRIGTARSPTATAAVPEASHIEGEDGAAAAPSSRR